MKRHKRSLDQRYLNCALPPTFALLNEPIQGVGSTLDNTFKDTKIEFEDLDGLSWPKKPTPPQAEPSSPPLEPLFGPGKPGIPTTIYETGWINAPPSPACCQCGSNRSACPLHARKLSRSRRSSDINFTFPQATLYDPFAFIPVIPGEEEETDPQERTQTGVSIVRPPSAKNTERQSRPFKMLELPPEVDPSSIGLPPGLPPPRQGLQPLQGIQFPTQD